MPSITYECSVNKSHPQRMSAAQPQTVPMCCNKPMVEVKKAAPVAAACPASPGAAPCSTPQSAAMTPKTPQSSTQKPPTMPQTPVPVKQSPSGTKPPQKR